MRIDIKNKQPVPAVYNVKQFSDAAYRFVFYVPLNELPDENIVSAAVKTINFTKGLDIEAVKADKDSWIIKPEDDYDSHGVYAGGDIDQEEWEELVDRMTDQGYVAMEYSFEPSCSRVAISVLTV